MRDGGPLGLGQKWGRLHWLPSLTVVGVVVLGLLLYVPFDAVCIVSPARAPERGQLVPRCYCSPGTPST